MMSAMFPERIKISDIDLAAFCQKYQIRKLVLFESVLREDFNSQSDVDILVEFEPNTKIGFLS